MEEEEEEERVEKENHCGDKELSSNTKQMKRVTGSLRKKDVGSVFFFYPKFL